MKKIQLILLFLLFSSKGFTQDTVFARKMVDTLTARSFWGRGYTNNGMQLAADFIARQYKEFGLTPMNGKSYFQSHTYPVNTFPGAMDVSIDGVALKPGRDFIIAPDSRGVKVAGTLVKKDSTHFADTTNRVFLSLEHKLTWSVADEEAGYTWIMADRKAIAHNPVSISVNIENVFVPDFTANNVCGFVKGTARADSFIVITAHYDHLGGMGRDTYFPGANDNASGMSFLLGMARYYAAHPQRYSIAFVCFSGEEAGILGSKYFTEHPLVDLENIRFLLNVDLVGTGQDGITVVNATLHNKEFGWLNELSQDKKYLPKIVSRGKAANSDHYFFTEKGVPAFFVYTMGGIRAYHDVFDISRTLPLTKYSDLFELVLRFNERLQAER